MVAPATTPSQATEHNAEIKKLDRSIKTVDEARQAVHRQLRLLGEAVDKKANGLVSDAKQKSKTIPGAKQSGLNADNLKKQFEQVAHQLEQMKQNLGRIGGVGG